MKFHLRGSSRACRPLENVSVAIFWILLSVTNIIVFYRLLVYRPDSSKIVSGGVVNSDVHEYTYVGDDFPENYPMPELLEPVLLTVEESTHYPLAGADALKQWASTAPRSIGYVRLGAPQRTLCVSMFHQLHCLRALRLRIDEGVGSLAHAQHCLNYLRQMVLCSPDLTLEPFDPLKRDFEVQRTGATHECRDWRTVYAEIDRNWDAWRRDANATDGDSEK
ncbi:hypothetical protein EW146_g9027 [Bondarzewia mesenterica]|uniref:DUF3328 domain-containing protein n=1 Tax=Bondarzewia mesenterica TaxID=1095465 RepID=A0A4S4L9I8_9AGAM|nr:hypothetical protein EW146_g9027 [Bondarzewia mesenterica]